MLNTRQKEKVEIGLPELSWLKYGYRDKVVELHRRDEIRRVLSGSSPTYQDLELLYNLKLLYPTELRLYLTERAGLLAGVPLWDIELYYEEQQVTREVLVLLKEYLRTTLSGLGYTLPIISPSDITLNSEICCSQDLIEQTYEYENGTGLLGCGCVCCGCDCGTMQECCDSCINEYGLIEEHIKDIKIELHRYLSVKLGGPYILTLESVVKDVTEEDEKKLRYTYARGE